MTDYRMPSLGADMEVGTVLEWRVKPGDVVDRGDIMALVDTEKAEIEIEIWETGVVSQILVPVGEEVPVGTVLARLEGLQDARPPKASLPLAEPTSSSPPDTPASPVLAAPPGTPRHRASPRARRLAGERSLDLAHIEGTGEAGAIRSQDVERARASRGSTSAGTDRDTSIRRAIARAMERSHREIPHYHLGTTIDLRPATQWLARENQRRSVSERLLPSVLFLKATARALDRVPELNGHWVDGAFRPSATVHLGIAIALRGGGLMAPAIRDADRKDLDTLMAEFRDLANRTRHGKLRGSEVSEATITITSLGELGVEQVHGLIYPPQVALVGFGRIHEKPWAESGILDVRRVVSTTLAADHRVSDGVRGSKFLNALADGLARPGEL